MQHHFSCIAILLVLTFTRLSGGGICAAEASRLTFPEAPQFELSPTAPLAGVLTFTTERECAVSVEVVSHDRRETVAVDPRPSQHHHIPVLGLRPDCEYELEIRATVDGEAMTVPSVTFRTDPLPDDIPDIRITRSQLERMEPGLTVMSLFRWDDDVASKSYGMFLVVDAVGEVVWYYRVGSPAAGLHRSDDGTLQFIHGLHPMRLRQIDCLGTTLREFASVALDNVSSEESIPVDVDTFHHDFAPLTDNAVLALTTEVRSVARFPLNVARPRRGLGPANVVGDVIAHIDADGEVVHRWHLLDILDSQRVTYGSYDTFWDTRAYEHVAGGTKDWSHSNAIVRDPRDGGIVVSMRHQDAIVKIDAESSEVQWILGTPSGWRPPLRNKVLRPTSRLEWPYHQHGVKFTPHGTLLMYDNGNLRAIPPARPMSARDSYSRAVEYRIDEEAMTVTQVWSYGSPSGEDQFFSPFLCDADWLPQTGNILITDGAHVTDENDEQVNSPPGAHQWARLVEVTHDEDPEVVWELFIDDRQTRPDIGWSVYRAERIPSLYPASTTVETDD